MATRNFLNDNQVTKLQNHTTAATDAVTSDIIDVSGFEGVCFITSFGTAAANNTAKVQGDSDPAGGSMADLLGTSVSTGTTDEDVFIEVYRPRQRYLRLVVARGTSSTLESIYAIRFGAKVPQLAGNSIAGTSIAEHHTSPIPGTA